MKKLPISILYVENDASLRKIYSKLLDNVIKKVWVANNGVEGLESYKKHRPDLILTDIKMEVMNGLEMISRIKKIDKNARVIILSAFSEPGYFLRAISYGVKGYLLKPIDSEVLIKQIESQANDILLDFKVKQEEQKRWEAEKAKERSEAILQALAFATRVFFTEGFESNSVFKVLERIGKSTHSSRVYIFQNFKDDVGKPFVSQIYEWVKSGIKSEIDNPDLKQIYFDEPALQRWVKTMSGKGYIHGLIKDLKEGPEKEILESQNIISILAMPIFVEDQWWGFIGLDDCINERIWSENEIKAMETLAANLGAAIYRKQVETELIELNFHLEKRVTERTKALEKEISQRKLAQLKLKESEEKYRLIYEHANNGILLVIKKKIVLVNPEASSIFKLKPFDLIGKPLSNFIIKENHDIFNEYFDGIKQRHAENSIDIRIINGEGLLRWVEMKTNVILWDGNEANLIFVSDITNRKIAEEKIKILNKELESKVEKEVKKVQLQQQLLVQKSKLESIGELSAGLAHEINQPLGGISMGMENMLFRIEEDGKVNKDYLKEKISLLFKDIERINKIIQHVRIFSRDQQNVKLEPVNAVLAIQNALSMMSVQLQNHGFKLDVELVKHPVIIKGNLYRIEQVILNLLSNAKYAIDEKAKSHNFEKIISVKCSKNNELCFISVRDNGTGISQKYINNIFDPFFTTKNEEKGTGLGLSISYGIVKEMEGEIKVISKANKFTEFKISIPLIKDEAFMIE